MKLLVLLVSIISFTWSWAGDCDGTLSHFAQAKESHSYRGNFIIERGSHGEKITNYSEKIKHLESLSPSVRKFALHYFDKNKRYPTYEMILDHLISTRASIVKAAQAMKIKNEDIDTYIDIFVRSMTLSEKQIENVQSFRESHGNFLSKVYDPRFDGEELILLKRFRYPIWGDLGELDMAMRLAGVKWQGLKLANKRGRLSRRMVKYRNLFREAKDNFLKEWQKKSSQEQKEILGKYPLINERVRSFSDKSLENPFKEVIFWIESKEIDLIVEREGRRIVLVEVKNYRDEFSVKDLLRRHGNGKSILDQQVELKEILSLLELGDIFKPAIVFRRGVSQEGRELLENHGVEVL